jgi:hypothetical protein
LAALFYRLCYCFYLASQQFDFSLQSLNALMDALSVLRPFGPNGSKKITDMYWLAWRSMGVSFLWVGLDLMVFHKGLQIAGAGNKINLSDKHYQVYGVKVLRASKTSSQVGLSINRRIKLPA